MRVQRFSAATNEPLWVSWCSRTGEVARQTHGNRGVSKTGSRSPAATNEQALVCLSNKQALVCLSNKQALVCLINKCKSTRAMRADVDNFIAKWRITFFFFYLC